MFVLKLTSNISRPNLNVPLVLLMVLAILATILMPGPSARPARATAIRVALITDTGGINDQSFNALAWQGLSRAQTDFGIIASYYVSTTQADYATNLAQCVADGNNLCVSVGFLMADATLTAANANPTRKFAIVDVTYDSYPTNLRGITFGVDQPSYMAGVLAALMSQTKTVGDIGGMAIPQVTAFTEAFRNGVMCAEANSGKVLLDYTNDFGNPTLGAQVAQTMIAHGADVIFSPAGATGSGAVLSATQSGNWGIGVDVDFYNTVFGNGTVAGSNKLLTSVLKKIDNAVYATVKDIVLNSFTSGSKSYGLAEDGTGLAPFHEMDTLIPPAVKTHLDQVKSEIMAGNINVNVRCPNTATRTVGLITDAGGVNDQSFNSLAWQGVLRAQSDLGVVASLYESATQDDYATNLAQCVADGNSLCVSVGFLTGDAILAAANTYPNTKFAIADFTYATYPNNLRGIAFQVDQSAYLAGVLAGSMSQTKTVGDIAGMDIPPVTMFTNAFRNGVLCANRNATVLAQFTNDFDNPDHGAQVAQTMISQGADVIFSAAGATGNGATLSATQSGRWGIGVDVDIYVNVFGNGTVAGSNKLLTSVLKKIDNAVYATVKDIVLSTFSSGTKYYNLSQDGTGLAPYHMTDAAISPAIKARLEQVKRDIENGKIDVNSSLCKSYNFVPMIKK